MEQSHRSPVTKDRGVAVGAVIVGAAYLIEAMRMEEPITDDAIGPDAFPILLGVLLIVSGGTLLLLRLRRESAASPGSDEEASPTDTVGVPLRLVGLYVLAPAIVYVLLIPYLGFVPASIGYLAVVLWKFRPNRTLSNIAISVITSLAIGVLFGVLLDVPMPLWPYAMGGGL